MHWLEEKQTKALVDWGVVAGVLHEGNTKGLSRGTVPVLRTYLHAGPWIASGYLYRLATNAISGRSTLGRGKGPIGVITLHEAFTGRIH